MYLIIIFKELSAKKKTIELIQELITTDTLYQTKYNLD